MKAAAFDYVAPRDVPDALKALGSEGAKLIAGGQSLGPMLNLRLVRPRLLIDISRIDALRAVEPRGGKLWIGAAVTHATIEDKLDGMLGVVASGIAYRSIRNRGTIGGSLAHADPAADWPLALAALDGNVQLVGTAGRRQVPADRFMLGAFTTALAEAEMIEGIEVSMPSAAARWGYYKFCRKTGEFPEASAAVLLDPERRVARIFLGALDGPPKRCEALEQQVAARQALSPEDIAETLAGVEIEAAARRIHGAALARAVRQAIGS